MLIQIQYFVLYSIGHHGLPLLHTHTPPCHQSGLPATQNISRVKLTCNIRMWVGLQDLIVEIHIHTCAYTHTHIHTYTHTCIHTYMHTHIHAYTHTCIHTHVHTYIHIHTYTHIMYRHTYNTLSLYEDASCLMGLMTIKCRPAKVCTRLAPYRCRSTCNTLDSFRCNNSVRSSTRSQ